MLSEFVYRMTECFGPDNFIVDLYNCIVLETLRTSYDAIGIGVTVRDKDVNWSRIATNVVAFEIAPPNVLFRPVFDHIRRFDFPNNLDFIRMMRLFVPNNAIKRRVELQRAVPAFENALVRVVGITYHIKITTVSGRCDGSIRLFRDSQLLACLYVRCVTLSCA